MHCEDFYKKITNTNMTIYKNIEHTTVNFVDDSTNVISFPSHDNVKSYLTNYYKLFHNYYNINKLKINPDKTNLIINYLPKYNNNFLNFHFFASNYKISPKNIVKILGTYLRSDLKLDSQVGKLTGELHSRIFEVRKLTKYTNFATRLKFINAFVVGKLIYCLPLYMHTTELLKQKLHKVQMSAARCVIGSFCYKKSIKYILNKCKWDTVKNVIINSSIMFIHKVIKNQKPEVIYELYNINRRSTAKIALHYHPKSKIYSAFFSNKTIEIYNKIPKVIINQKI
jgi:hypothetical protein